MSNINVVIPKIPRESVPGNIIYEVVVGDVLYGTYTLDKEIQIRGVYLAREKDLMVHDIKSTIKLGEDGNIIYYELSKFLSMLQTGETLAYEMLFTPKCYIIRQHRSFIDTVGARKLVFMTAAFGKSIIWDTDYCISNMNLTKKDAKKIYDDMNDLNKIDIHDFITVLSQRDFYKESYNFKKYLSRIYNDAPLVINNFASVPIDGFENIRHLYYDREGTFAKGIYDVEKDEFRKYNIPKLKMPIAIIGTDIKEYHRKRNKFIIDTDYKNSLEDDWLVSNDGIHYNAKYFMNCIRKLDMALDFFNKGIFKVTREKEANYYLAILRGEVKFKDVLSSLLRKRDHLDILLEDASVNKFTPNILLKHLQIDVRKSYLLLEKEKKENDIQEIEQTEG